MVRINIAIALATSNWNKIRPPSGMQNKSTWLTMGTQMLGIEQLLGPLRGGTENSTIA
jgi:hypothetical protein